jgi:hypothetical protein
VTALEDNAAGKGNQAQLLFLARLKQADESERYYVGQASCLSPF